MSRGYAGSGSHGTDGTALAAAAGLVDVRTQPGEGFVGVVDLATGERAPAKVRSDGVVCGPARLKGKFGIRMDAGNDGWQGSDRPQVQG